MTDTPEQTVYNHTEMTEITQYNVEDVYKDGSDSELAFGKPKTYVPVFHGLQQRPGDDNPTQLYEGHVEIGGPSQTPWDLEEFDDEILAQSGRERDIHPDAISITPASGIAYLGNPASESIPFNKFVAIVTPTEYEFPVIWSASPSGKVTIDNGVVTPVALGEDITITATSGAVSATATVTVEKIAVSGVTLNETELSLEVGDTSQLEATIAPAGALVKDVAWSSNDTSVATVEDGLVTAVANGIATITVTSTDDNTKTATCTVTVFTSVTGVELDESSITLTEGGTQQLTATISPETASDQAVIWSSNDETVATVENGLVTALTAGEAIITVTSHADGTITDTCSVTVNAAE